MIGRLASINLPKAKDIDLFPNMPAITLGRNPTCNVKLEDNRCSSFHCRVSAELVSNEWVFTVEDLSTNGTYLNTAKVNLYLDWKRKQSCCQMGQCP